MVTFKVQIENQKTQPLQVWSKINSITEKLHNNGHHKARIKFQITFIKFDLWSEMISQITTEFNKCLEHVLTQVTVKAALLRTNILN